VIRPSRRSLLAGAALAVTAVLAGTAGADPLPPTGGCTTTTTWKQTGVTTFQLPEAGLRSQGITTDGKSWYFSWQFGLEHTTDNYLTTFARPLAIPGPLLLAGSSHIGDIDWYKDKLVVPIEDGYDGYQHPYLAFANPTTLQIGSYGAVPWNLQTEGVPWVAVNQETGIAYTAEWNKTTQINLFDLNHHFNYVRSIKLQYKLPRIQGAKYYQGSLYASVDDAANTVYKIRLKDGSITKLFSLNEGDEMEGIAVRPMPDGSLLHVIQEYGDVSKPTSGYHGELHHYAPVHTKHC
jgi:hypothetical protein